MSTPGQFNESDVNRQANGEFGTIPRAEADGVTLVVEPVSDEQIREALGVDPATLTADEQRVLAVLLDPKVARGLGYSDDPEWIVEEYEDFDGEGLYETSQIAERVGSQYDSMSYVLETSYPDSSEWQYSVAQYCGHDKGYLSSTGDTKYLDPDRHLGSGEHTGLRKALAVATYLDGEFRDVQARARRLGLIETPAPEHDLENLPDYLPRTTSESGLAYGAANGAVALNLNHAMSSHMAILNMRPNVVLTGDGHGWAGTSGLVMRTAVKDLASEGPFEACFVIDNEDGTAQVLHSTVVAADDQKATLIDGRTVTFDESLVAVAF